MQFSACPRFGNHLNALQIFNFVIFCILDDQDIGDVMLLDVYHVNFMLGTFAF